MTTLEQFNNHVMPTYKQQEMVLVSGKNATCYDENGKEYIDFGSGIGVNSLGFANEAWAKAVADQAASLQHVSNLYYSKPVGELATLLAQATGYAKIFAANSGAEANEGAIKVLRKYSSDKYGPGRHKILTLENSFHGRSYGALSATGQPSMHQHFGPFLEGFTFVPSNDFSAAKEALDQGGYCGVILEFIQGEGGVNPLDRNYVQELFAYCQEKDILIHADEVQTGVGRTGKFLAAEHFGVKPQVVTLAKGLGGGLPIGVVMVEDRLADVLGYGDHGATYGGNPVACAGAKVVMAQMMTPGFMEEVTKKGAYLREELLKLEQVVAVDGMGLMLGLQLKDKDAATVVKEAVAQGLIPLTAKTKLRLLPPLTITQAELDKGLEILKKVLA